MKYLVTALAAFTAALLPIAAAGLEIPNAQQPQLSVAPDGTVWLAYGQNGSVFVTESSDGGSSFAAARQVGNAHNLTFGMRRGPRIAAQGDRVTITVPGDELVAYTSSDHGKTWTGPVAVNDTPGSSREGLHDLAAGPDGRLFAVWLDQRSGPMEVWSAESTDGGRSWGQNQLVYHSPDKSVCECCHPSALFDAEGNLAVMWRNSVGGCRDLWMSVRAQGRRDFPPGKKLCTGTWPLNACPMDGGRIVALGAGKFASVWQRAGEIYYAPWDGAETLLGKGRQPIALRYGGVTTVYWQDDAGLVSKQVDSPNAPEKRAANARFAAVAQAVDDRSHAVLAYEQSATAAAAIKHGPAMHTAAGQAAAAAKTTTVVVERL